MQAQITDEELDPPNTKFVVLGNMDDDPHPHILGVFETKDEAHELSKQCGNVVNGPWPVAWNVFKITGTEWEQISP